MFQSVSHLQLEYELIQNSIYDNSAVFMTVFKTYVIAGFQFLIFLNFDYNFVDFQSSIFPLSINRSGNDSKKSKNIK